MIRSKIRTERHELLLTPDEKKKWMSKAQTNGLNLNEYIRSCVDKRRPSLPLPPVNRVVAVELGRIGTNLNQQIRAMNTALASGQEINNVDETMTLKGTTLVLQTLPASVALIFVWLAYNQSKTKG